MKKYVLFILILSLTFNFVNQTMLWANGRDCNDGTTTDIRDFCYGNVDGKGDMDDSAGHILNLRGTDRTILEGPDESTFKILTFIDWLMEYLVKLIYWTSE